MKKILDFGNKIGGARKDLWATRYMIASDLEAMNDAELNKYVTRDYVWPLPNSKKMVEDGLDAFVAFWQREVRKSVLKAPYLYKEQDKKEAMSLYVELVGKVRDYVMGIKSRSEIFGFFKITDENFGYTTREWVQCINTRALAGARYGQSRMLRKMQNQNFPYGNKKAAKKPRKKAFIPPQLDHIEREGENFRHGLHVDERWWQKDFNFYGVEFGNWLSQKDRQYSMDYCYDGLKDLAIALNIDDLDISFNGALSLAFGARGNSRASAHYEELRRVINLTKMHGAGCTAHEWCHALDHAIGLFYGVTDKTMASESKQTEKLPKVFVDLVKALKEDAQGNKTDYYIGSSRFDTHFAKDAYGYWRSNCEMFARAFACFVKDSLGYKSDYLIAHADCYVFEYDNMAACAIPQDEERELFNELFAQLFYKLKKDGFLHNPVTKSETVLAKVSEPYPDFRLESNGQYWLF